MNVTVKVQGFTVPVNQDGSDTLSEIGLHLMKIARLTCPDYAYAQHDFETELKRITSNWTDEEDVSLPATIAQSLACGLAYQIGYTQGEIYRLRAKHEETRGLEHYETWTRNPLLVKRHEDAFRRYLEEHKPTLLQALDMLKSGKTIQETAVRLEYRKWKELRKDLGNAFSTFLDKQ